MAVIRRSMNNYFKTVILFFLVGMLLLAKRKKFSTNVVTKKPWWRSTDLTQGRCFYQWAEPCWLLEFRQWRRHTKCENTFSKWRLSCSNTNFRYWWSKQNGYWVQYRNRNDFIWDDKITVWFHISRNLILLFINVISPFILYLLKSSPLSW